MPPQISPTPSFGEPYAADDVALARNLFTTASLSAAAEGRIDDLARTLIGAIRSRGTALGGIEALLREYSLSSKEGLALMVLAEALLRVPDPATADRLIEEKLGQGDFPHHETHSRSPLVNASAWALGRAARLIEVGETPEGILGELTRRLGFPAVRAAIRGAMRALGHHFVLGQSIEEALDRARSRSSRRYRYSFDMLGEGARTAEDAEHYFDSYSRAIEAIGRSAGNESLPERPGISVKFSALHPRYEAVSRERVLRELTPRVVELARIARQHELAFTVDAEEADRLELSLDVIAATLRDASLSGWDGFGLAVQAYQKRALAVIDWTVSLAEALDRRLMVRLVKGAYWDTEIKRAQERGLADYPVFTRKAMTDLNYLACAQKLLALRSRLFPQFATHNAVTVASIIERAGGPRGDYEFQRLHGMGEGLYEALMETVPGAACRTYAPVGGHRDLLAYLVRRLLENGANSSFVSAAADPEVPVESLLRRPVEVLGTPERARHPRLPLPRDLYAPERCNSRGIEFGFARELNGLIAEASGANTPMHSAPIVEGIAGRGKKRELLSPIDQKCVGAVVEADPEVADAAMKAAQRGFPCWSQSSTETRAAALERASHLLEERRGRFLKLLQVEGGKTLDDALSEVREGIDFCRYYAAEGRKLFRDRGLPGPAGESNVLRLRGRGVFVAISPWNFPLAIFLGQVTAALMAGNTVVAKPAEQTPLVAFEAVRLLHDAGVPVSALHLVPGDGRLGAQLVKHAATSGVVFTGSTEVARHINRSLAAREGPILPLIAETGGTNAMIVDATALPEQVADDVITSAFRSAGQRCSALRILYVQEDVADRIVAMIAGAARQLKVGDPREVSTHVGPIIDAEAKRRLDQQIAFLKRTAKLRYAWGDPAGEAETGNGTTLLVGPHVFEMGARAEVAEEIFGPVLQVVRFPAPQFGTVLEEIERSGYGLTLGIQSRIDATSDWAVGALQVGNVYVNRNMIGAVVGVQPFGGHGLSGTGPKAGGPHYLLRFATEQTTSVNTAAVGGSAILLAMEE